MPIVKVCWSGGKDSTCAVLKHIERGNKVKVVCYVPMFTKEIPLILIDHYEHILRTAQYFKDLGAEVHIVTGMVYWDYVTHIAKTGKYKGMIFGFPCFIRGQCGFKRDSKEKAIKNCDVGSYDYTDIGIAYDETDRHKQLSDIKRSILVEEKITEAEATTICWRHNVLSPIYTRTGRDGCVLCPNAKASEREQWFKDFPGVRDKLIELQNIVKANRPDRFPLRNYKWFIESEDTQ